VVAAQLLAHHLKALYRRRHPGFTERAAVKRFIERHLAVLVVLPLAAIGLLGPGPAADALPDRDIVATPQARAQTVPVPSRGDAADDPAIWVHPTDPARSLILGTDKQGGLHVYNLDGTQHQLVGDKSRPNNVDVLYGYRLGGNEVDLAVASTRSDQARGVKVWRIDAKTRTLADVTEGSVLKVFGGREPYGLCTYRSAKDGKPYFFVNAKSGEVEQHLLLDAGQGKVRSRKVRTLRLKSQPEGCVADGELGHLYIGEESVGVWKFPAEPDAGTQGKLIAKVGRHGLKADVEGLTIYHATGGKGYLIVSSQGNNTFKVYTREGDNAFVLTIDPAGGKIDDVNDTDGICVTSCPTSKAFSKGLFVVQDGTNARGNQNFKLYAWEDIAGNRLLIDTRWSPRGK
jgi:3-phytase